jgi:ketosteroid isomerase-like protein
MKQAMLAVLFVTGSMYMTGQPAKTGTAATTKVSANSSVENALKQMERDWGQAEIKKDYEAVDRILADDWVGIDYDGKVVAKADAMAHLKAGESTLTSEVIGLMTVRVFGNTAIVTGSDTEKSTDRGKDSSGKYVWTDVFVLRNGKWQVAASQSTRAQ